MVLKWHITGKEILRTKFLKDRENCNIPDLENPSSCVHASTRTKTLAVICNLLSKTLILYVFTVTFHALHAWPLHWELMILIMVICGQVYEELTMIMKDLNMWNKERVLSKSMRQTRVLNSNCDLSASCYAY